MRLNARRRIVALTALVCAAVLSAGCGAEDAPPPDRDDHGGFLSQPVGVVRVSSGRDPHGRSIAVSATVGRDGDTLVLVLDRSSFAAGETRPFSEGSPPLDEFAFRADVTVELSEKRLLHDDLGAGGERFPYP